MKLKLLFASLCLFTSVLFAEAVSSPKDKKPMDKKPMDKKPPTDKKPPVDKKLPIPQGKIEFTPSPKAIDIAKGGKPPVFKGPNTKSEPYMLVKENSKKWKTDPAQKAAVDKLLGGKASLSDQERQQLSDLLFNAQDAGLTREDEAALSYLLLDETARNAGETAAETPSEEKAGPFYVRIYNNTGERLKVWVQVVSDAEPKKEEEPEAKKPTPLQYDLETGKAYDLQQNGARLKASAIRVWAMSPTRSWAQHRDQVLILTTPPNNSKAYTLTFSK